MNRISDFFKADACDEEGVPGLALSWKVNGQLVRVLTFVFTEEELASCDLPERYEWCVFRLRDGRYLAQSVSR